jgi:hypothetical protein
MAKIHVVCHRSCTGQCDQVRAVIRQPGINSLTGNTSCLCVTLPFIKVIASFQFHLLQVLTVIIRSILSHEIWIKRLVIINIKYCTDTFSIFSFLEYFYFLLWCGCNHGLYFRLFRASACHYGRLCCRSYSTPWCTAVTSPRWRRVGARYVARLRAANETGHMGSRTLAIVKTAWARSSVLPVGRCEDPSTTMVIEAIDATFSEFASLILVDKESLFWVEEG